MDVQLAAPPRPVAPRARLLSLDVLRGLAIFGVLLSSLIWDFGQRPRESLSGFERGLLLFFEFSVDSKFYTLLSFLFGFGFFLILSRAGERNSNATLLYCRRLAVLACFGVANALLLRDGDILFPYAVTGLFLLPFRKASDRVVLTGAIAMAFFSKLARLLWEWSGYPLPALPETAGMGHFAHNLEWAKYYYSSGPLIWFGSNLSTFLLGLYAARNGTLERLAKRPSALRWITGIGLVLGLALYVARELYLRTMTISDPTMTERLVAGTIFQAHLWSMAAAYIAAILLMLRTERLQRRLQPIAATGRMALTNYLMQPMLVVPIAAAFQLYDRFTPGVSLALALGLFFLVQLPFSVLWLRHFDFGPFEALWRRLTYGKRRRTAPSG